MDMLFKKLHAGDFLTFIALCIAAFAFLCQYLSFPKNFLKYLTYFNQNEAKELSDNKKKIIYFFFVIDLFIGWILVFLIFAMIGSLGFLIASLQLSWWEYPHKNLRWFLFVGSIVYTIFMVYIFIFVYRFRREYWEKKSRLGWTIFCFLLLLLENIPLFIFSWPFSQFSLSGFFVTLLGNLTVLFICIVFALCRYNPLTELAKIWKILGLELGKIDKKER